MLQTDETRCSSLANDYNNFKDEFDNFMTKEHENLEKQFHSKHNFHTTIQGLKVRGCYETLKEATYRAKRLQRNDPRFNVYVASVGKWVPFSPNADDIKNHEYANEQLNELMKRYKENEDNHDIHFQQQKEELRLSAIEDTKKKKQLLEKQNMLEDEETKDQEQKDSSS